MRLNTAQKLEDTAEPYQAPEFVPFPRRELRGLERYTVALGEGINRNSRTKKVASAFGRAFSCRLVTWASKRRWRIFGSEELASIHAKHSVILVGNHRSFFDMYVAAAMLYTNADFVERIHFPVRSKFFYDHAAGPLVNLLMSGHAMWPPVFRDDRRSSLNQIGIQQMAWALAKPGALLGIHPEGARQTGDDPYTLGPARPGVGHLVLACPPETRILPFFVLGMGNDLGKEIRYRLTGGSGPDIRMHWGAPRRCGDLREQSADPGAIAEDLLEIVHDLGRQDRLAIARGPRPS